MNVILKPKSGAAGVAIPQWKYDVAMANGDFDAVNDKVVVEGVEYELKSRETEVLDTEVTSTGG